MSPVRTTVVGATRTCPHCRATILESATVCPGCKHHLRFGAAANDRGPDGTVALRVDGTIEQPASATACEYSVLLVIRNERGEEVARHVAGVGAIQPAERRSFTLTVETTATHLSRRPPPV